MDAADMAQRQMAAQGVRHVDPLKGVDVEAEYLKIMAGKSGLCERIQQLVIARWENGQ